MPDSILFVCLGNICRSPMAEAVMRDLLKREGLADRIAVDSAGTGDWHVGHPPHEGPAASSTRTASLMRDSARDSCGRMTESGSASSWRWTAATNGIFGHGSRRAIGRPLSGS